MPDEILSGQIDAVLSDIGADAIKIGMLHSSDFVRIVAEKIKQYSIKNIVLDPVMVSTSGHRLIEERAVEVIKNALLPLVRVLTPNVPEAEILIGRPINGECDFHSVAKELATKYNVSVLLKAGHLSGDTLTDYFYNVENCGRIHADNMRRTEDCVMTLLPSKRVYTQNTHGTGCTLSSAIAAALAKGEDLTSAAKSAKSYLEEAIISGADYEIGHGHGPVNHFWRQ